MTRKLWKGSFLSLLLVLVATLALFVAGCTQPESAGEKTEPAAATEEQKTEGTEEAAKPAVEAYKIGAVLSVTGKASFLGDPEKKTLEILAKKLNDNGGINGVPVELIIEDDGGAEDKTIAAAEKLVYKDNVLAVIGPSRSGNSMAIKNFMDEEKTPLLSCAAAEAIVEPVSPWVFKTPQKDSYAAKHILMYMQENGITNIAVMYGGTGFGQGGLEQIKKFSADYGVTVAMEESYAPTATEADLETLLMKIKADESIQAIVNWSILPAQSIVPKKMEALQMDNVLLFHSHGFGNINYVRNAGPAADGVLFPAGRLLVAAELPDDNAQKAILVEYANEYKAAFPDEEVSTFGGHAADAFWLVVNAIEKAGADKEGIRKAIEETKDFAGTGGIFSFTAEDHNGLGLDSLMMLTVKDGKFAIPE